MTLASSVQTSTGTRASSTGSWACAAAHSASSHIPAPCTGAHAIDISGVLVLHASISHDAILTTECALRSRFLKQGFRWCVSSACRAQHHCQLPADLVASLPSEKVYDRDARDGHSFRVLKRDLGPLLQQVRPIQCHLVNDLREVYWLLGLATGVQYVSFKRGSTTMCTLVCGRPAVALRTLHMPCACGSCMLLGCTASNVHHPHVPTAQVHGKHVTSVAAYERQCADNKQAKADALADRRKQAAERKALKLAKQQVTLPAALRPVLGHWR